MLLNEARRLWLFGGDSITQGARHTHGARSYVQLFEEELRYRRHLVDQVVVNAAVDGSTVASGGEALSEWLRRLTPSSVCLMFGTNDSKSTAGMPADASAFAESLGELVSVAQRLGAQVALATPPPVRGEQAESVRLALPGFVARVRDVAERSGALLVDHAAAWDDADLDALMDDDVHPNARGHERLASTLIAALEPWLGAR